MAPAARGCIQMAVTWRRMAGCTAACCACCAPPCPTLCPQSLEERPLNEVLGDVHLVRIERHGPSHGANLRRGLLGRRLDVLTLERRLHHRRAIRHWRNPAKDD